MKKHSIILMTVIITAILTTIVFANNINQLLINVVQYKVMINGDKKNFENPIITINDRTYIPLREVGEALGMNVEWFGRSQTIIMQTPYNDDEESLLYPFELKENPTNLRWGYKDAFGNVIIEPQFFGASEFKEGLARVRTSGGQDGQYGYINVKGDFIIPSQYMYANNFSEGIALITTGNVDDYRYYYIDKSGNALFDGKQFLYASDFREGYAVILTKGYSGFDAPIEELKNNRYSYINKQGKYATEQEFEQAMSFKNGLAAVKNNGKWGMINSKFELVVDYLYDNVSELMK